MLIALPGEVGSGHAEAGIIGPRALSGLDWMTRQATVLRRAQTCGARESRPSSGWVQRECRHPRLVRNCTRYIESRVGNAALWRILEAVCKRHIFFIAYRLLKYSTSTGQSGPQAEQGVWIGLAH